MEPEGTLPHSQEPATCPYPETAMPYHPTSWRSILVLFSQLHAVNLLVSYPLKILIKIYHLLYKGQYYCWLNACYHSVQNL